LESLGDCGGKKIAAEPVIVREQAKQYSYNINNTLKKYL
jgi:hypothetical protein